MQQQQPVPGMQARYEPQLCLLAFADQSSDLHRNFITATAAIAGFSSVLFGFLTNMPVCLAPGMGINAYFAYQIVGHHGSGIISYNLALTAVFVEGFIFLGLSLVGMRQWLVKVIPVSLKIAAACGIGLFLAEVGLSSTSGIGAISGAVNTPLMISGCPDQYKDEFGVCTSHKMTSPTVSSTFLDAFRHWLINIDVARDYGWRYSGRIFDGFQSQECYDHCYSSCVHHLMAVGYLLSLWNGIELTLV
jgi:hypothetical protein